MKISSDRWQNLGISLRFNLIFALLFAILLLISATAFFAFHYIEQAEERIRNSKNITNHLLTMNHGMERAQRLHRDFFLNYEELGLQRAHEEYAQPSAREIAQVLLMNEDLKALLGDSGDNTIFSKHQAELNLYLASARRFADTSIEAVELLTERAAPKRGVEPQLMITCQALESILAPFEDLHTNMISACSTAKDYFLHRTRSKMQTAFNQLYDVEQSIASYDLLAAPVKSDLINKTQEFITLGEELLEIDREISAKFNDFYLQQQNLEPITATLLDLTQKAEMEAESNINTVWMVSIIIVSLSVIIGLSALLLVSRLITSTVTNVVLKLNDTATAFSSGDLDARITMKNQDELGKLGMLFNSMAQHLSELIRNLENQVTERTQELATSEERFRKLVKELPHIAVQGVDEDGVITYWNRASELLFGYSREEAIGRHSDKLSPQVAARGKTLIQEQVTERIHTEAGERIFTHKNGSQVHVYRSHVEQVDSHGCTTFFSIDIDLAELKRAQRQIVKSELFYRTLFNHSSSGVCIFEPVNGGADFVIKDINSAGSIIEGLTREFLLNKRVSEVLPSIRLHGLHILFNEVLQSGKPSYRETTLMDEDKLQVSRDNRVYLMPSGELVCVFDDTTEQKKALLAHKQMEGALQRAQKMEAIGVMAGGIAHDLNNTLSAIVGYPDLLLLQLEDNSPLAKPLAAMKSAGERAAAIVADLLTVARGVATTKQPCNLNTMILEFFKSPEFAEISRSHSQIEFNHYLAAELPPSPCSPIHVKKCLVYLLENAIESTGHRGKIIFSTRVTGSPSAHSIDHGQEEEYAVLRVSDDGEPISSKDLEHIFEPFYTKRNMGRTGGTGLGLSVVWNTMHEHQGKVIPKSENGLNSFDLYFPLNQLRLTPDALQEEASHLDLNGDGKSVLVIDDEEQQRSLARDILEHYGYTVHCQGSGEDGVKFLKKHAVDLVVLDMIMPHGLNGRQTYKEIISLYPNQKAIIASGFSESEDINETLRMGAGQFLKKPFTMKALATSVKKELNQ